MATFWERASYSVDHMFSLYLDNSLFWLFPVLVLRVGFWSDCSSSWSLHTCYFYNVFPKTSPCNEDPLTPHFYIVKLGFTGVYIIFLFLL